MSKITSNKQFTSRLNGVRKSTRAMKRDVQDLLVFGFAQYAKHGNLTFMNRLRQTAITERAIPVTALNGYITDHANVKWSATKYVKTGKKAIVKALDGQWFDSINADAGTDKAPAKTNVVKIGKQALKSLNTKHEKELLEDDEKFERAQTLMAQLIVDLEAIDAE